MNELVNKATLMQICLGVGIAMGDAHFLHFHEDGEEYPKSAPDYIKDSPWAFSEYKRLEIYLVSMWNDLEAFIREYVELLNTEAIMFNSAPQ